MSGPCAESEMIIEQDSTTIGIVSAMIMAIISHLEYATNKIRSSVCLRTINPIYSHSIVLTISSKSFCTSFSSFAGPSTQRWRRIPLSGVGSHIRIDEK
jgi:hypothetical protein